MMVYMLHMGNSGKFAVMAGIVAAGLLILTGMTLAEPVFIAFLGVLGMAYLACVLEILRRRRLVVLVIAGASTSLAVAGSLAFLSTWELAFADERSFFGTPLPTSDPDNYFFLAALSLVVALVVLFAGAVWPGRQRSVPRTTGGRTPSRGSGQRTSSARQVPQRQSVARQGIARQGTARQGTAKQGAAKPSQRRPAPKK
jgi:hypothetical protein